jgi:predicted transcriptional regulator
MQTSYVTTKKIMIDIISAQPEDASFEEIMKELSFERMVESGMKDLREGRLITHKEMGERIQKW